MHGVMFTGTGFCVGDNITFICDIISNGHQWSIADGSQKPISRATTQSLMVGPDNKFTLAVVRPLPKDSIVSTLSVTAYSGFNGVSITCNDGVDTRTDPRTSTASLLG